MSTLNKISLDGTVYDIGGANKLPVENFPVTGTNLSLIKTTEMGTHVYYVTRDSTFRYRVDGDSSWRYISGPGMVYSYKDGSDEDMDKWYDIMFYGTDKIVKYHKDYNDSFPKGYTEVAFAANANANGICHIKEDTTPINLTGEYDIGVVVTGTSYITLSWIDNDSSEPKTMNLPCGTFILGSTTAAAVGNGDNVIIITPTGQQYAITDITSTGATITETTPLNTRVLTSAPFQSASSALDFDSLEKGFYRYDWMPAAISMYYTYTDTNNTVQTKSFTVSNTDSTGTTGANLNFRRIEMEVYNKWTDVKKTAANNTPIAKIKFYPSSTFYYDNPGTQYSAYYVEYVFYKYNDGISKDLQGAYYDKSEIDTKIADYKLLGDFAVITGNYAYEESVTDKEITLSYPTGFTRDNCVVISIMLGNTAIKTKPLGCNSVMTSNSTATGAVANSVVLFESNIRLKLRNLYAKDYVESTTPQIMSQELPNLEYKVVLMKIPTQE